MLQRIDLCKLQPKHAYAIASVASLGGIHERKWEKAKKCLQLTRNTHVALKRLACCVALKYCLKDLPCCTEWIDVCYKCIRDLIWMNMEPLHAWIHVPL